MFWNMTIRRLGGAAIPLFPKTFAARPDLETGTRLLAMATEAGILLTLSGPPPAALRPVPPMGGAPGVPRPDRLGRDALRRVGDEAS